MALSLGSTDVYITIIEYKVKISKSISYKTVMSHFVFENIRRFDENGFVEVKKKEKKKRTTPKDSQKMAVFSHFLSSTLPSLLHPNPLVCRRGIQNEHSVVLSRAFLETSS